MNKERFMYDDARRGYEFIDDNIRGAGLHPDNVHDAVILGSGLGDFANKYLDEHSVHIPFNAIYNEINKHSGNSPIPLSEGGAPGHAQELIIGPLKGDTQKRCVIAQVGREHPYEDVRTERATFWLRIMQLMGVETLFGSNAVGIVTPDTLPLPALMLVMDHLDFGNDDPLVGANEKRFGPRFPHSGDLYPEQSRDLVKAVAARLNIPLKEGVLFRMMGPEYENKSTIYRLRAMLRGIYEEAKRQPGEKDFNGEPVGAVGMSTTFEHLVAQHASPSQGNHPNRAFGKGRTRLNSLFCVAGRSAQEVG